MSWTPWYITIGISLIILSIVWLWVEAEKEEE